MPAQKCPERAPTPISKITEIYGSCQNFPTMVLAANVPPRAKRNARPGENGTRPGSAVQTKIDVSHMSRKEMEEMERRAMRGEVITL